ncbi:tumor necrosis factor receptor superfamily member 5 isoform X1 [Pteropus vampyrus]|uniref:Tumor necrosis factor receptor superfamily member 5 n=1 Tax=Pteropus vampyrus TaxID=132908 RepID=A0A6P3QN19_PTEVA|nr:tumor necrosis factor receptor superfamily member 5 isoform X1 [Pteropus vampyrus]
MIRLPLQCLLWGFLLTAVHPEPPTECRENQYLINSQCCNLCPPGEKLVNECTETANTKCFPCSEGEFLGTWNNERHCHQHKYCDPNLGLLVQTNGTSKTDTTCMCGEGQYCTSDACERCIPHRLCPPGFEVQQIATGVSDTICKPCPVGFFSNVSSAFEKCHRWTSCESKNLVELQAGTNKTDAVCGFQDRMRALVLIPIIMGILTIVLLVPVCIRKMTKEPENEAYHFKNQRQVPVETIDIDFPGPHSTAPVQETLHGCQPVTQEDGKESRISVQERQ